MLWIASWTVFLKVLQKNLVLHTADKNSLAILQNIPVLCTDGYP